MDSSIDEFIEHLSVHGHLAVWNYKSSIKSLKKNRCCLPKANINDQSRSIREKKAR